MTPLTVLAPAPVCHCLSLLSVLGVQLLKFQADWSSLRRNRHVDP